MGGIEPDKFYEVMSNTIKKRRILFLFSHLHKGGMQRAVSNISRALPYEFEQFVGFFGTEDPGFLYNATLHCFELPGAIAMGPLVKIANAWKRLRVIRNYVIEKQIDVVVSFGESANIYSLTSGHQAKKIITSRVALNESLAGNGFYARAYRFMVNRLYPRADAVVTVSEALAKDMRLITRGNCAVSHIPNLYHTDEIQQSSKEALPHHLEFLNKVRFILNVGSLCYQKAQDDLLKIFKRVHDKHEDVFLVIQGRGEWEIQLKELAELLGILENVIFIDYEPNPYKYMAKTEVFVLTSRYEGFPNVLVEAMICGAPVVAFDCPTGPEEILGADSSYGNLITNRSIDEAADKICILLSDSSAMQDARTKSKLRGQFYEASKIVSQWVDLF